MTDNTERWFPWGVSILGIILLLAWVWVSSQGPASAQRDLKADWSSVKSSQATIEMWQGFMKVLWPAIDDPQYKLSEKFKVYDTIKEIQSACYEAVDDWEKVMKYHTDDNVYRTLPKFKKESCEEFDK